MKVSWGYRYALKGFWCSSMLPLVLNHIAVHFGHSIITQIQFHWNFNLDCGSLEGRLGNYWVSKMKRNMLQQQWNHAWASKSLEILSISTAQLHFALEYVYLGTVWVIVECPKCKAICFSTNGSIMRIQNLCKLCCLKTVQLHVYPRLRFFGDRLVDYWVSKM